ncbi:glycine zipper family protein [Wolbachia endosymbiont (group B) of Villa cingulata]|uniref:glycine zipper family protein n=1 Tax=Wolbachia endosymbiont (group B) of Villa cingulata TaxID=3066157 RepID=UPI003340EE6A
MVQGGAVNPINSDELIENVVEYISKKKDLLQKLQSLLTLRGFERKSEIFDKSYIDSMSKFLIGNKDILGSVIGLILEDIEKNKIESKEFLEQVDKVKGMEKELETLGNQLLAQGLISGAAFTTLTGALAGTLAIGGVAGALIIGGAALVGFVALVAIVAIGYAIYQNRSEIKESVGKGTSKTVQGIVESGKAVKSFVKDVIDKLPTIQDRDKNFYKLYQKLSQLALQSGTEGSEIKNIQDKAKVIEMLRNEGQQSAIQELVKNGTIQNFSEDDMSRLLNKGLGTHLDDQRVLEELMEKFQPEIMAIGEGKIEKVEEIINEKVAAMKPYSQVDSPSSEQVSEEGITRPS